ncbi:zinc-binding alcohol dehydrogenase family protein [Microbacterium fluvii]|uniref:Zinc-binding alcohol dehydrogenase family protein n=1 Tax=Microbacterium fluvii TaxID=415215 RepID=A0ABW2HGH7_9MICO|nr:zinc-binding alcohol dehydrogenase family protein [Microbacterium fluvii]MCU4673990.1 zinc-binding alcohol dehydrogenase family protein [Microbacterium fluvii]
MRAVVLTAPDAAPEAAEFPEPAPVPGHEPLRLVGAGLHQVVRSLAAGRHYGSGAQYPLVPGVDAVARTADGRLVYTGWPRAPWGTMAETLATPVGLELPSGADPFAIAAGMNPAMSGWMPLSQHLEARGALGTVLVLGATGMSGGMAVREAFALGAERVIAAGRDAGALEALRATGAEPVSIADGPDELAAAVSAHTPSLVLDYLWGPVAETAFAALGRRGLDDDTADISYVQIGGLAGLDARVPAALLRSRSIRISGSGAGSVSTERMLAELPRIMGLIADGTLPVPYTAYPFSRAAEAWGHTGRSRAVIVPD